jgi:hypothetical protein
MTQHYSAGTQAMPQITTTRSVRRASGYVLVAIPDKWNSMSLTKSAVIFKWKCTLLSVYLKIAISQNAINIPIINRPEPVPSDIQTSL